jgi:hypothetical protein
MMHLLETANAIDFVSRMHNCGSTSLCPGEYNINEIRRVGDRPHLLEVVD